MVDFEILLTLKSENKIFAEPKHIRLLMLIETSGSLSQAAKLNNMSYKSAWDAVNQMNLLAGKPIVDKVVGGKGGGKAIVTAYGRRFIQLYNLLHQIQVKALGVLQDSSLPLDSLLAAIARFSLQTSARNQFFATVENISEVGHRIKLTLSLSNSQLKLDAFITSQSVNNLDIYCGKEVLALIKASGVQVIKDPRDLLNVWQVNVDKILEGNEQADVDFSSILSPNIVFHGLVEQGDLVQNRLKHHDQVLVHIDPENVIIATLR